jgi:hypothetical protein
MVITAVRISTVRISTVIAAMIITTAIVPVAVVMAVRPVIGVSEPEGDYRRTNDDARRTIIIIRRIRIGICGRANRRRINRCWRRN